MSLDKTKSAALTAHPNWVMVDGAVINYGEMVNALVKKMPEEVEDLLHGAVGVAGEAGELLDAVKKHWVYNKPLDKANIIEELGDLQFYMTAIMLVLGLSLEQVLQANADKLAVRYAGLKYSDEAAQTRADKVELPPVGTPVDDLPVVMLDEPEMQDFKGTRAITGWPQQQGIAVVIPAPVIQLVTSAAEGRLLGNPEAPDRP